MPLTRTLVSLLLVLLCGIGLAGCYDEVFPDGDALGGEAGSSSPYDATMTLGAADPHPGDVIAFTFSVSDGGAPLDGISPAATYMQTSGGDAMGEIPLTADATLGSWTGQRAFPAAGTYAVELAYADPVDGAPIVERFTVTLDSH